MTDTEALRKALKIISNGPYIQTRPGVSVETLMLERVLDAARRWLALAEGEEVIEAMARSRWDARFGEGSWRNWSNTTPYHPSGYSQDAFRQSARRDWQAVLAAITEEGE